MAESIVSLRHVNKYFGENHVLKDINLEIEGSDVHVKGIPQMLYNCTQ